MVFWMGVGLLTLAAVLCTRAVLCRTRGRKLTQKRPAASAEEQQAYARRLGEMIACRTVSVKGSFAPAEFERLRQVIASLFPEVTRRAELRIFGEDCYLYRLAGRDPQRNVMLMSHHDVVAADGPWRYPPFAGTIAEERLWGRGTVDTKTPLFAEFTALEELLRAGWTPPCNVYLVSSHNEEIAGDGVPLVRRWLEEQQLRFDWILDEGGAVIDPPMGGIRCRCAMMAVHEKGRYALRLRAAAPAGHGSLSPQDTPAVRMARLIAQVDRKPPFRRRLHPEVRAMFEGLAPVMNFPMRVVFANLWLFGGLLPKLIPALNAQAGAMLGTTCTFRNLQTAPEGDCTAEAFFRCVRQEDLQEELEIFRGLAQAQGVEVTDVLEDEFYRPAHLDSEGYRLIRSCVERCFGEAACAPFILPAGTDARHFSGLSDAVIRFAPIDLDAQQYASVHQQDENISLEAIPRAVHFYRELLRGL